MYGTCNLRGAYLMVDISLCNGNGCVKRELCIRYTLLPRADPLWQSYVSSAD